jgi:hypothetical protein
MARLTEIASVLDRSGTAALAVALGFIRLDEWPEPDSLCIYPLGSYASSPNLADFGMTRSHIEQLARAMRAAKKSEFGRPPRDLALSILDDSQKAKVAAFEKELELASEALGRGTLRYRYISQVSCK